MTLRIARDGSDAYNKIMIKEAIQQCYEGQARLKSKLVKYKRTYGFCGGFTSCMEYTGHDEHVCSKCRKLIGAPQHSINRSEYGKIRMKEREQERLEREREEAEKTKEDKKKTAPRHVHAA